MKTICLISILSGCIVFGFSCKKSNTANNYEVFSSIPIYMFVENAQGQSLLNSATKGYYDASKIRKYDLIDGQAKLYYRPNLTWYNGLTVTNQMGNIYLVVIPNVDSEESPTTTYIDWGNGDKDTLMCAMTKSESGYFNQVTDIWYNGTKVYPENAVGDKAFKVVK